MFGKDTRPGMLRYYYRSATCVQRFDDSLSCAIRITYRSSQRSSSLHEPRDPPLKVVRIVNYDNFQNCYISYRMGFGFFGLTLCFSFDGESKKNRVHSLVFVKGDSHVNDPSAGSPTETLLRLLLPLNGKV